MIDWFSSIALQQAQPIRGCPIYLPLAEIDRTARKRLPFNEADRLIDYYAQADLANVRSGSVAVILPEAR